MTYDRSIRMFDEAHTPEKLDELKKKGVLNKGKFLNEQFHFSQYLQMKTIFDLQVDSVLEIGPGEGFVASYMNGLGISYDTLDRDSANNPTIVSDLRDWTVPGQEWDLVAAFQVLEHMPFSSFENNIAKLAAASRKYVFISLPYHCFGLSFRLCASFGQKKRRTFDFGMHFPTFFRNRRYRKEYMDEFPFAVHFWELGRRPIFPWTVEKTFKRKQLKIISRFHSPNPYHYFYLLEKQHSSG